MRSEDEGRFWMNFLKPHTNDRDIVAKIKHNTRIRETFIALFSIVALVISQFEYEIEYYPKMYTDDEKLKNSYKGHPVRIVISCICALLAYLCIVNNYTFYRMKLEEKKIIKGKTNLTFSFIFKDLLF